MQREEIQKLLGARIRKLRGERGWTQDEFADLSGLHRAQVGAFENGRMNITLGSLQLVAQTLGVRIMDLFKGVERTPVQVQRKDSAFREPPKRGGSRKD